MLKKKLNRRTWAIKPVTQVTPNKKRYNRKKLVDKNSDL